MEAVLIGFIVLFIGSYLSWLYDETDFFNYLVFFSFLSVPAYGIGKLVLFIMEQF